MIRYPILASLLVILVIAGASAAQEGGQQATDAASETLEAAYQALQGQEYAAAYDLFYSLASQDHQRAQYELGSLYHRGAGVAADAARAARWYARSAEQGYADAQYRLGNMYMMGEGVPQSDTEAVHWHEKAAQQGHADARRNLDSLRRISAAKTRKELELEAASLPPLKVKDKTAARDNEGKEDKRGFFKRWFGKEEEAGKAVAETPRQQALQPEPTAHTVAAATATASDRTEPAPAAAAAGAKTEEGESRASATVDKEEQPDTAADKALRPPAQTADDGQRPAPLAGSAAVSNYELGMAYLLGNTLEQDYAKALEHFTRAAQAGYAPAQYRLGVAYANGDGTTKNPGRAVEWYGKSAAQGHTVAQRSLAVIYINGLEDVAPDKPLALAWYSLLAEDGNQMDVHRRDTLLQALSEEEISLAQELATGIRDRLSAGE